MDSRYELEEVLVGLAEFSGHYPPRFAEEMVKWVVMTLLLLLEPGSADLRRNAHRNLLHFVDKLIFSSPVLNK